MITGIIGCERGGTSAVAVVCKALGLKMYGCDHTLDDVEMFGKNAHRQKILRDRAKIGGDWGWKYPHEYGTRELSYTDRFIVVYRCPLATTSRCDARARLTGRAIQKILQQHNALTTIKDPKLEISYEKLLTDTEKTVSQIADFLDLPVNEDALRVVDHTLGYDSTKMYNEDMVEWRKSVTKNGTL